MEPEVTTITEDLNIPSENQIINDFYIVSLLKLVILFSCTLGLYMVYWFYRQWKQQKDVAGEDCWPIMRGIFLIFFTHSLFEKIDKKLRLTEKKYDWSPEYTATLFVILVLASRISDKLALNGIGLPYSDIAGLLILPIIAGLLIYVQRIINFTCDDIEGESNSQFTSLNFLWITVGIIFIALYLISPVLTPSA
jgi:hypothetical protein